MVEKYKHVIWDWNGTIFNDVELGIDIINKLLTKRNLPVLTTETYKDVFTIPVEDYYAEVGFDFSKEPFKVVGQFWMDEYELRKFECGLYENVVDVMKKNQNLGIGQSILSAYSQHTLDEMIDHYELRKYFTHVVGLDNIYAASKMHLGKDLMKRLGNGKGETLVIGDTLHDYEVAMEIGADCVLISNGHQSKKRLLEATSIVIDSIEQLL